MSTALKPNVTFIPIARPTFDVDLAKSVMSEAIELLREAAFDLNAHDALIMNNHDLAGFLKDFDAFDTDLVILFQASFADSSMALKVAQTVNKPLLLWAVPEARVGGRLRLNSFCGINLAAHGLKRAGFHYEYLYAPANSVEALEKIRVVAAAAAVKMRLNWARIGRVGENPAGFDTCLFDADALKARMGLEVVQLQLADIFEGAKQADAGAVAAVEAQVHEKVAGLDEMEPEPMRGTLSTYVTMRDVAEAQKLDGIAVRCWPEFFTEMGCAACGAMSMMSDGGTPASCEADVNGTITQLILQWLSGEAAFGTDMVDFDVESDTAILWHCGLAPLSMADPDSVPQAALHSNRQKPLLMEFPLKPGRVTVARLSEASGKMKLVVGTGEMLQAPPAFTGTSGTFRFDSGTQAAMDTILREGLEHHVSITYGDHVAALLALAQMLEMDVIRI